MTATAPEPTDGEYQAAQDAKHRRLLWICGGVALVLVIIGLFTYGAGSDDRQAQQKAEQLAQKFEQAGLVVPEDLEVFTTILGTDGGAVCADPANALRFASLHDQITNGADFVGRRPVIVDRKVLLGEALILETYCPDKLKPYQDKVDELKTDNVIKN
jgi:hypothetical protein